MQRDSPPTSIEGIDVEIGASIGGPQPDLRITYKVPRIVVKDYSGPAGLQRPSASASVIDIYRSALEQFAAVTAASVSVPSIAGTINFGAATPGGASSSISGLALQGIKGGKIATMQVDRCQLSRSTRNTAGKADKMTGEFRQSRLATISTPTAIAAILDPQKANDDRYYRFYRQTTTGPYTITSAQGLRMRIDGMTIDGVGVRPSRLQLPALLAMMPAARGAPPTPAQTRELIDKMAALYEGMRIGNAEMRGFSVETPQGPFKLAAIRFNLEDGKIGEFAFEGLRYDARRKGPFKLGRFALKSLDIANFMRMSAQFANPAQPPSPELIARAVAAASRASRSRASSRPSRTPASPSTSTAST